MRGCVLPRNRLALFQELAFAHGDPGAGVVRTATHSCFLLYEQSNRLFAYVLRFRQEPSQPRVEARRIRFDLRPQLLELLDVLPFDDIVRFWFLTANVNPDTLADRISKNRTERRHPGDVASEVIQPLLRRPSTVAPNSIDLYLVMEQILSRRRGLTQFVTDRSVKELGQTQLQIFSIRVLRCRAVHEGRPAGRRASC